MQPLKKGGNMPNDIAKLRRLMKVANYFHQRMFRKQATEHAWYFERLRTAMQTGIVRFSYWKKDGSIREAVGTLRTVLIPPDKRPHTTEDESSVNYETFAYFDLYTNDWRSFRLEHFIGFVDIWLLEVGSLKRERTKEKTIRIEP